MTARQARVLGIAALLVLLFFLPTAALLVSLVVFCFGAIVHVRRVERERLDMIEAEQKIAAWRDES